MARRINEWKPGPWQRQRKVPAKRLAAVIEAHDRAQSASDQLRAAVGLEPVPENQSVRAWRMRLAEADAKPVRSVKRASPDQPASVGEIGDLRRKRDAYVRRVESQMTRLVAELRDAGVPMRQIADELGMTREGAYQFVKRASRAKVAA